MADIKSAIESSRYIFTTTVISHSGVRKLSKCYDELVKGGADVEIFERDKPITRELISNLLSSHRHTDCEVRAQVDAEVAAAERSSWRSCTNTTRSTRFSSQRKTAETTEVQQ